MARALSGSVAWHPTTGAHGPPHWKCRVTAPDGTRPWLHLGGKFTDRSARGRERAEEAARGKVERLSTMEKVPASSETIEGDYITRWLKERSSRLKPIASVPDDKSRLEIWLVPFLLKRGKTIETADEKDLEAFVAHLDASVLAGKIRWKTAGNIWLVTKKLFADACGGSRQAALRVRTKECAQVHPGPACGVVHYQDSPCGKHGPSTGDDREKPFLYPNEFQQLMSCDRVPHERRRIYALAIYLYARAAELRALSWSDVDLDRGSVHIHQAVERKTGALKSTKKGTGRRFLIEANLLPLIKAMHEEGKSPTVIPRMPKVSELSKTLRCDLRAAGVLRAHLHVKKDATLRHLVFHDLRATGLCWQAMRGDQAADIMERAGHEDFATTKSYVSRGRQLAKAFGDVFPKLHVGLLQSSPESSFRMRPGPQPRAAKRFSTVEPTGIENAESAIKQASPCDSGVSENVLSQPPTPNPASTGTPDDCRDDSSPPDDGRSATLVSLRRALDVAIASGDVTAITTVASAIASLSKGGAP